MLSGGLGFMAYTVIKLGACFVGTNGLIILVKWFNTYEWTKKSDKKKGSDKNDADGLEDIREKHGSKS